MLDFIGLNVGAFVVVWGVYMVVGAIWYSPAGFAQQWHKYTGVDIMKIPTRRANEILLAVALSSLVQAIALGVIINSLDVTSLLNGLLIGLALWLGFTTATTVGVTLYQRLSWGFFWINSAYFLVVMTLGSIIFTLWQ
jgi:hypothetical protein